ncbi:MAG: hypothetical protein QW470_00455 [Candidatus Caldarchaeum sp.]
MTLDIASKEFYMKLLDNVMLKVSRQNSAAGDRVLELKPNLVHDAKNTILTNLGQIAKTLNREPAHFARFLLKETGRAGSISDDKLLIQGKMNLEETRRLIDLYIKEFVRCPVCNGIDTRIVSEKRFRFLVCDACGAKNPVRKI